MKVQISSEEVLLLIFWLNTPTIYSSYTVHGFKSAILAIFQNGTFQHVHEIWKKFWPKVFFWSNMKMATRKNIHNILRIITVNKNAYWVRAKRRWLSIYEEVHVQTHDEIKKRQAPEPNWNPGFMQEKVQKGDFQKSPRKNWNFVFVLGSYESLEGLER